MRIQSLKTPLDVAVAVPPLPHADNAADTAARSDQAGNSGGVAERQELEIALLKARIQHLELVIETARSLMGSNQERLLRRLHEAPREIAALSAQLRRVDPQGAW